MLRISFDDLRTSIEHVFLRLGLAPDRAALSARLTAETDFDGVDTHGIARLPRFAEMVRIGSIDPQAAPECTASFGALERWSGHRGPGNLAAHAAMTRAMELAAQHGLGAVALGDTTHWQRGGAFGWQAAEAGFAAICWTNTLPNLPAWGATQATLGNNPLVLAIPNVNGHSHSEPIVLDMALSQYSYGTLAKYRERAEPLPVPGGYDEAGQLTSDPGAIERSQRALPIGYWKGSGLSFALDVLGAMLAGGKAAHQLSTDPLQEVGLSQVFLAIAPTAIDSVAHLHAIANAAIEALHNATPVTPGRPPRYPGERTLITREENLRLGVPVDPSQWQALQTLGR
jgi:3-dehydro-L-gulonate 2-dehydrogenase